MGRAQPERRLPSRRLYLLMRLFIGVRKDLVRRVLLLKQFLQIWQFYEVPCSSKSFG
jgi:hypothetical protein